MLLKITIPVETGNAAVKNGTIQQHIESLFQSLQPEAAYFYTEHGLRTAHVYFNMDDTSKIPGIAEPLFLGLNAGVSFKPVMNIDDMEKGLGEFMKGGHH
jgi:hypothetical protein